MNYVLEAELKNGERKLLNLKQTRCADHVHLLLPRAEVPADFRVLRLLPGLFDTAVGADGYYVATYCNGPFLTRFHERPDCAMRWKADYLSFCGKADGHQATMLILGGMRLGAEFVAEVRGGVYSLTAEIDAAYSDVYEDISAELYELSGADADYSGMARCYRAYQLHRGACRTLREKAAERPLLDELAHTPEIRIRMAWKPAPSPVPEQTPETEPPMHVACTFAQVERLVAELQRQGIRGAELCLVGWNMRGHDGRYPQIFPVEPALGGEAGLRHLIQVAQQAGYRIVCHTNSSDAYSVSEDWSPDIIMKNADQSLSKNAVWSGGQMYNLRPVLAEQFAHRDLPRVRELGFCGSHYIDVLSTVAPYRDFDSVHPVNRAQCAEAWLRIMQYAAELFGGISSEGTHDYTAGVVDFGLYSAFDLMGKQPELADETIPLYPLVYHGITLYNPSAETINFPVKSRAERLKFFEYGGRPAIYYYARFKESGSNWMGEDDFLMGTPEQLTDSVTRIKKMMEDYEPFADEQYAFMQRHEQLAAGLYRITYSDGNVMLCNARTEPAEWAGVTVPAQDFVWCRAEK